MCREIHSLLGGELTLWDSNKHNYIITLASELPSATLPAPIIPSREEIITTLQGLIATINSFYSSLHCSVLAAYTTVANYYMTQTFHHTTVTFVHQVATGNTKDGVINHTPPPLPACNTWPNTTHYLTQELSTLYSYITLVLPTLTLMSIDLVSSHRLLKISFPFFKQSAIRTNHSHTIPHVKPQS